MIHFHFDYFFLCLFFFFLFFFFAVICCDAVEQSVEAIPVGFNSPRGGLRCLSRPECLCFFCVLFRFVFVLCLLSARAFPCFFFARVSSSRVRRWWWRRGSCWVSAVSRPARWEPQPRSGRRTEHRSGSCPCDPDSAPDSDAGYSPRYSRCWTPNFPASWGRKRGIRNI